MERHSTATNPPTAASKYDVFISHAGPDKLAMAEPLFKALTLHNVPTFLDMEALQIHQGTAPEEMMRAMAEAQVAVFILSPEFAAREWPVKELRAFLDRDRIAKAEGRRRPVLLPLFFRLTVADCSQPDKRIYGAEHGHRDLCSRNGFFEKERQAQCSTEQAVAAFRELRAYSGVEVPRIGGGDDLSSAEMVSEAARRVLDYLGIKRTGAAAGIGKLGNEEESFLACVDVPANPPHVVLRFQSSLQYGEASAPPSTVEDRLKRTVLQSDGSLSIGAVGSSLAACGVGMEGMSGVGKSCALRGLAKDADVVDRFRGGIYLINLGRDAKNADVIQQVAQMIEVSGGRRTSREVLEKGGIDAARSLNTAVFKAKVWFRGKCVLLLIDDVWEDSESGRNVVALLSEIIDIGKGSRLVFTTRDLRITMRSEVIHFAARDAATSMNILLGSAGVHEENVAHFRGTIEKVLKLCDGLPMALAVVGSAVRLRLASTAGSTMAEIWEQYVLEVQKHHKILLRGTVDNDGYGTLESAFMASLSMMDRNLDTFVFRPKMLCSEMYRALIVSRAQGWLPVTVLERLWESEDEVEASHMMQAFVDANLALGQARVLNGKKTAGISLHDLHLGFVREGCRGHGEVVMWPRKLLSTYFPDPSSSNSEASVAARDWCEDGVFQDEYIRNNVSRHLVDAGLEGELCRLLENPNWTVRRLRAHEIPALEEDFGSLSELQYERVPFRVHWWALRMIRGAARLSSPYVSQNPGEAWFQLYSRLVRRANETKNPVLMKYIAEIDECAERPWLKTYFPCLPEPGLALQSTVLCEGPVMWISENMGQGIREMFACGIRFEDGAIFFSIVLNGQVEGTTWLSLKEGRANISTNLPSSNVERSERSRSLNESAPRTVGIAEVSAVCCARAGTRVVTGHEDGTIQLWDVPTGKAVGDALRGHDAPIWNVVVSPDGTQLASGSLDKTVRLWNMQTGEAVGDALHGHNEGVNCVAWSPDETHIVSGSDDRTLLVWDVQNGSAVGDALRGHMSGVNCVAWSPDGTRLASGSNDCTIRLWDAQTGRAMCGPVHEMCGMLVRFHPNRFLSFSHYRAVTCVAWAPDGTRLLSGSMDKTVRVWDGQTGLSVGEVLFGHADEVWDVAWCADKKYIVSCSRDGTVRVWDVWRVEYNLGGDVVGDDNYRENVHVFLDREESVVGEKLRVEEGRRVVVGSGDDVSILATFEGPILQLRSSRRGQIRDVRSVHFVELVE